MDHSLSDALFRASAALIGCVAIAVVIWLYNYQEQIKNRELTLRALFVLVAAVAIGLQVGLLLVRWTFEPFPF